MDPSLSAGADDGSRLFERIYASGWHNPGIIWVAGVLFLVALSWRRSFLFGYLTIFTVAILADAAQSGAFAPAQIAQAGFGLPVVITFIILGDFRYFLLIERYATVREGEPRFSLVGPGSWKAWAVAVPLAFIVPVGSTIIHTGLYPRYFEIPRRTFLLYEAMFLTLVLVMRFVVLPRKLQHTAPDVRAWLLRVTAFVGAHYALWALSDVLILSGVATGNLLRIVPNLMYYAAFLPYVWWTAPKGMLREDAP
jgi:hypothetical protein